MTNPIRAQPRRRASGGPPTRWSGWSKALLTPRGQVLMAAALFGLAEVLALPLLVVALLVMPFRDGASTMQVNPGLAWACLAVVVGIPALCSLFFYAKVRQAVAHLRPADDPDQENGRLA